MIIAISSAQSKLCKIVIFVAGGYNSKFIVNPFNPFRSDPIVFIKKFHPIERLSLLK